MAALAKISTSITLLGRKFPLRVAADESNLVQSIEKELNQKLRDFMNQYKDMNNEAALSMALISYAFELSQTIENFDENAIEKRLEKVEKTLTSAIHSLS